MKAIVLAAGYATRLYPLTKDKPKALLPIGKGVMMDYLFSEIAGISIIDEAVIVSNHRFAGQFEDWAASARTRWPRLNIAVLDDGTTGNDNRLGAVGDMAFARRELGLDDDWLVAASDNFFTFRLSDFVNDFLRHGRDTVLVHPQDDPEECKRFAIAELDSQGRVTDLVEKPQNPKSNLAVYALYLYRRDTVPLIEQYLREGNNPDAPGHFPEWLYTRREVRAYQFDGECADIGTVESYREICEKYKGR